MKRTERQMNACVRGSKRKGREGKGREREGKGREGKTCELLLLRREIVLLMLFWSLEAFDHLHMHEHRASLFFMGQNTIKTNHFHCYGPFHLTKEERNKRSQKSEIRNQKSEKG